MDLTALSRAGPRRAGRARRSGGGLRAQLPRTIELPWARRRRLRAERGTVVLGVAACGLTSAVLGGELWRMLRERMQAHPELEPRECADVAARETVAVAVAGLESMTARETALLNLLASFTLTFAAARAGTYAIHRSGPTGPLRDLVVGERHIHHFVPGIAIAFLAGGAAVVSRDERIDPVVAVPFGIGVALTLDESALLLSLDDVYWSEEGIVSLQITLAALALLSSAALTRRALRRGEQRMRLAASPVPATETETETESATPPLAATARPASR